MDALKAIKIRRSIRNYTGAPVPLEDLEKIIDARRLAASGSNLQPWDFVIITNKSTIKQLSKAAD